MGVIRYNGDRGRTNLSTGKKTSAPKQSPKAPKTPMPQPKQPRKPCPNTGDPMDDCLD